MPKKFSSSVTASLPFSTSGSSGGRNGLVPAAKSERAKSEGAKSDSSSRSTTEKFAARAEKALKHDTSESGSVSLSSSRSIRNGYAAATKSAEDHAILLNLGGNGQVPFVGREKELASIGEVIDSLVSKGSQERQGGEQEEEKGSTRMEKQADSSYPRVISIVGSAGSGKSRLAGELKSQVLDRDGYFARGKCESTQTQNQEQAPPNTSGSNNDTNNNSSSNNSSTAYGALSNAMKDLTDQILARDFDMGIRRRLQEAVGSQDALILTEIFPSLSTILESNDFDDVDDEDEVESKQQEASPTLTQPSQDQRARRRRFLFQQFMRVLLLSSIDYCDEDVEAGVEQKPQNQEAFALVLVIDDCQWIDTASLDLVSALVRDQELENFLLVATIRPFHEEGEDTRPFAREAKQWQETNNIPLESYYLQSLDSFSINTIVATVLDTERELTSDLATIVHQKTNGNAFFALEFIKALVDQKLLYYSYKSMQWKWDTKKVQSLVIHGNSAVGLLIAKLDRLPCNQQLMMLVTACLGGTFEEGLMESIMRNLDGTQIHDSQQQEHCTIKGSEQEQKEQCTNVREMLDSLVRLGLLGHHADLYFIMHDLIREAALEFAPPERIGLIKLRIGEHILNNMIQTPQQQQQQDCTSSALLFLGVGLCNAGYTDQATIRTIEPTVLAEYNLLAGEKAMRESAFACALQYMEKGLTLLEKTGDTVKDESDHKSNNYYDRLLAGAAEASFCAGNADKVGTYVNNLLQRNCSMEHRLRMLHFKITSSTAKDNYETAFDHGWSAIKLLQMDTFPRKPKLFHVMKEIIKTKRRLRYHTKETLCALPILRDENRINAQKFFDLMQDASYLCNPTFFLVSQLKSVRWAVKYGVCKYTPAAFTLYGTILQSNLCNDVTRGVMFGDVALELAERLAVKETIARASMSMFGLLHHSTKDIRECYAPISFASKLAMECGDTTTAFNCYWYMDSYSWTCARLPLQALARDLERHVATCRDYNNYSVGDGLIFLATHLRKLCDGKDQPFRWLDFVMDNSYANRKDRQRAIAIQAFYDAVALESHFLLGEMAEALQYARKLRDVANISMGLATIYRTQYYRGLVFLKLAAAGQDTKKHLREVKAVLTMMKKWVDNGNVNCIHMRWLLEAEIARMKHQTDAAKKLYGDAIRMATRTQRIHDVGLSNNYASSFFLENDDRSRAAYHMQQAINGFRDLGASTIVRKLEEDHSDLLKDGGLIYREHSVFSIPK